MWRSACFLILVLLISPLSLAADRSARDAREGFDLSRLSLADDHIKRAIGDGKLPGAVLLVGRGDRIVYQKAYGDRALKPEREAMTLNTIFDLASLTKVVATTTSVMILVEEGRVRLSDRVATFIPEFAKHGKGDITVLHLLTHVSGLRPDLDLADEWRGYDKAIELATEEVPVARPTERFIYSDINFFLLGEIVRRVGGEPLDRFAAERIFRPLGMADTGFKPAESLRSRIAPTQNCTPYGWPCEGPDARILRGTVHDPTARRMDGVAGHAGLFSTAADLAVFCRMLLNGGQVNGKRVLSPLSVARMTSPSTPPGERNVRGLGWDMDSTYSSNRGELLPPGSFGHTGWTGTSLWLDPETGVFIVFLSNRVHPDGKGDVTPLRARIATTVAAALNDPSLTAEVRTRTPWTLQVRAAAGTPPSPAHEAGDTRSGIDVLRAEGFAALKGRRVGLVTNHTGRTRDGEATIDVLYRSKDVKLVALFAPEHGIRGILDDDVPSTRDERTGLTIHSLYGKTRRPAEEMLQGLDALVIDLQDVGVRFYTYITTMAYVIEEAAKRQLPVFIVDRPNPINGVQIEGPALDEGPPSFTGYFRSMPVRHGMTMGEMAQLFNGENNIGAMLTVLKMDNWSRDDWFDETGLPWINPSPNLRNLLQATLYPGIGAIEGSNISVGRGTDTPFEQIGAPWIHGVQLAAELNARELPGIRFYPVAFTPTASKYANQPCQGVFMVVTDRAGLRPVRVGLEIAAALYRLYGSKYEIDTAAGLLGSKESLARVKAGEDPADVAASWAAGEARWRQLRSKYLIYR